MSNEAIRLVAGYDHREEQIRQAEIAWHTLAKQLEERIPASCQKMAKEFGWVGYDDYGRFPRWLETLIVNTQVGSRLEPKIKANKLYHYGFETFDQMQAALDELQHAWEGVVKIEFTAMDDEVYLLTFQAAELID